MDRRRALNTAWIWPLASAILLPFLCIGAIYTGASWLFMQVDNRGGSPSSAATHVLANGVLAGFVLLIVAIVATLGNIIGWMLRR